MPQQAAASPLLTWLLILVSVVLVAGITYVYTNRDRYLTIIFTLFSIACIGLVKLVGMVDQKLQSHFIGAYNETQIPYVFAYPGWKQLFLAWHLWILPVIFILVIANIAFYLFYYYARKLAKEDKKAVILTPPLRTLSPAVKTGAERLSDFMAMDAAKKEIQKVNEKLAEALLLNAAYEIKAGDTDIRLNMLEKELADTKNRLGEENNILQLELSAKTRESDYILEQLAERSRELEHTQEMFEKLLALQQHESEKKKKK